MASIEIKSGSSHMKQTIESTMFVARCEPLLENHLLQRMSDSIMLLLTNYEVHREKYLNRIFKVRIQ